MHNKIHHRIKEDLEINRNPFSTLTKKENEIKEKLKDCVVTTTKCTKEG